MITQLIFNYMSMLQMKKRVTLVVLILFIFCALWTTHLHASVKTKDIPQPLTKALAVYKAKGVQEFIKTLVKDGPMEGNVEIKTQIATLEKIELYYGKYQSYDILNIKRLSDSIRLVYLIINFEKGAVFGKLVAFKNKNKETVTSFVFHTKPEKVLPEALLISH